MRLLFYILSLSLVLSSCSKHIDPEPAKITANTTGGVELIQIGQTVRIAAYIDAPLPNRHFFNIELHWASGLITGVFVMIPAGSTQIVEEFGAYGRLVSWKIIGEGNYHE